MTRKCDRCESGELKLKIIDPEILVNYTRMNLIEPRSRTGLCAKHQRSISRTIKMYRHLGIEKYI